MKVIDNVKMFGYGQWIEGFVSNVLTNATVHAAMVFICKMYNKRIYLISCNPFFGVCMTENYT